MRQTVIKLTSSNLNLHLLQVILQLKRWWIDFGHCLNFDHTADSLQAEVQKNPHTCCSSLQTDMKYIPFSFRSNVFKIFSM